VVAVAAAATLHLKCAQFSALCHALGNLMPLDDFFPESGLVNDLLTSRVRVPEHILDGVEHT
jgi:hypothetical protein